LVLTGTSLFCAAVVAAFAVAGGPWVACWALVAVAAAGYSPTRYALLPGAAPDAPVPLTPVHGPVGMGGRTARVVRREVGAGGGRRLGVRRGGGGARLGGTAGGGGAGGRARPARGTNRPAELVPARRAPPGAGRDGRGRVLPRHAPRAGRPPHALHASGPR